MGEIPSGVVEGSDPIGASGAEEVKTLADPGVLDEGLAGYENVVHVDENDPTVLGGGRRWVPPRQIRNIAAEIGNHSPMGKRTGESENSPADLGDSDRNLGLYQSLVQLDGNDNGAISLGRERRWAWLMPTGKQKEMEHSAPPGSSALDEGLAQFAANGGDSASLRQEQPPIGNGDGTAGATNGNRAVGSTPMDQFFDDVSLVFFLSLTTGTCLIFSLRKQF